MTVAATESAAEPRASVSGAAPATPVAGRRAAPAAGAGQPRWGVGATAMVALAGFMAILALLAIQLRNDPRSGGLVTVKPRVVILRRVYQTTVHERIVGASGPASGGTTVQSSSASVSGPATPAAAAPVTTRTS
jgi:hypothetical protein